MLLDARATPGLPRYSKAKGGGLRCYAQPRGTAAVQLVVLHQWGAHTSLVQRPGETLEACAIRRGRSVPYHLSVFANTIDPADPIVVWAWDETISSWASNGFNRTSVAIGVGGRFPEFESKRLSVHSALAGIESGLVSALGAVAAALPGLTIVTHRQSSSGRRADPGEGIARIAAKAAPGFGLRVDYQRTTGTGRSAAVWAENS